MAKKHKVKHFRKRAGSSPGTVQYVGRERQESIEIEVIHYNEHEIEHYTVSDVGGVKNYEDGITWINVTGVHETRVVTELGERFDIDSLVLEDIVNIGQRPKIEQHTDHLFLVAKMVYLHEQSKDITLEQISFLVWKNTLITFQERKKDILNPIRERLDGGNGQIRTKKTDYLLYALLDAMVDHYFVVLEELGDIIEVIEEEVVKVPSQVVLQKVHHIKRRVVELRKAIWPTREIINTLLHTEHSVIGESVDRYFRDLYDHTIHVIDTVESLRDVTASLNDLYASTIGNRMNEVMKFLTIFASIFIPLTFVAGVYGMNFQHMPELLWRWGYFIVLGVMFIIALGMLAYFRKKDWL